MPKNIAEYGGVLKVRIEKIEDFKDEAGFMDKTDPFVEVQCGEETFKTATKKNAGGAAEFNEEFAFNKKEGVAELKAKVYDKDTLNNDTLGERVFDLTDSAGWGTGPYECVKDGSVTGKLWMEITWDRKSLVDFAGPIKVTIEKIEDFTGSGMFDKADPYVAIECGGEKFRTETKDNAGGSAVFDQEFTFNKEEGVSEMKLSVLDTDMMTDDLLGERTIDFKEYDHEDSPYECAKDGEANGKVWLKISWAQ
mmetsp:Transcript_10466/g.21612  ORF Transcript_10466/g.21612 Transcript_10466/m.21612 type:complete len:251 (-) Transcript_10466:115-867(-)